MENGKVVLILSSCITLWLKLQAIDGHGYLSSPRSRNLLASQETVWWPQTEEDPEPETCPHCLNRGGSRSRCGISVGVRNYDTPRNALGGQMPTKIQATYTQGQNVILDVTLTAHHKGHFVFSACPISPGEIPTQECFDRHQLTFIEDLLHGGNYDPNYPERAYIAPVANPHYLPDIGSAKGIMEYSFNMILPQNLHGDLVLIQWYYLTANSCYHDGYLEYNWPNSWNIDATSSGMCGDVSSDGTGFPEQFWNCAEVRILQGPNEVVNPTPPPANKPTNRPSQMEISSGISIPVSLPLQSNNNGPSSTDSQTDISSGISIPVSLPLQSNNNKPSSAGSHGKTIVGYYASWQWYDRNKKAAPENMDFKKVQRVNFAFFQIDAEGNMWGTDSWADPNVLFGPYNWNPNEGSREYCSRDSATSKVCKHHNYEQGLIHLVHAAGAEIYPSLGGWTLSDPFPAMAASSTARERFAQNCVDLIVEYGFDGIDIDWEYPGYEDHSGTPQDRDNFKLVLDDVRAKLDELGAQMGKFYGLTAALPCGPRHIENMDIAHVASTLSELNLMTYDFHGAFSERTGTNAPMYDQGWGEEDFDVHSCVQNWLAGGGSRDKINIGLPFYGRSFGGATGLNQPHSGADKSVWGIDEGTPQYFNIAAQLPSMTTVWDKKTWTPFAFFDNGGLVSFDDENSICVKVQYAIENDLGGFLIWELSGDLMEDLSTPLLDVTNYKLHNPDFNCGEPGVYPEEVETSSVPAAPIASPLGQVLTPTLTNPSVFPGSAAPGTFPTPSFPILFTLAPSPEKLNPSEPATEYPYSQTAVNDQPLYDQPVTPSPEKLNPSEPAAEYPYIQTANEHTVDDHIVNDQPLYDQPVNDQPIIYHPALFLCGNQQGTFNIANSKSLELSFRYEVHMNVGVSVFDATKELKSTMLNGIAKQLNCAGAPSVVRRLRINPVETSQENVMAIESTQSDLTENDTPCSIPVNLGVNTICNSMIGSMTAHLKKRTSATVLSDVAEELLFYIKTSMASGKYETAIIRKVNYVENLSANPVESNAGSLQPNTPQSEGGTNSLIVAIVWSLLIVILIAFNMFLFTTRKRKIESRYAEERDTIITTETKYDSDEAMTTMPRASSSTEEYWKSELNTEEVWRNAINIYGEKSSTILADVVPPDEEEALDPVAVRTSPAELCAKQRIIRDLGKGSDAVTHQWRAGDENYPDDNFDAKANQDESPFDSDGERDEAVIAKEKRRTQKKKRRTQKKKKRSAARDGRMPMETDDKGMQGPDSNIEDEHNDYLFTDHDGNVNDDGKPISDDKINELAFNKEDGEGHEEHEMDNQSFGDSNSEGKIDPALDGHKKDEADDQLPSTMEEEGNHSHSDSNDGMVGIESNAAVSPSSYNTEQGTARGDDNAASNTQGESFPDGKQSQNDYQGLTSSAEYDICHDLD